ncbi:TPR-like protein [Rickenella mellea]|uniref:TPR-like protein n=1 Tax=Rickenella mellea TaxID=50990 RepID=A0A4Y7PVA0_9AGAM|nr:TPR-like protein [Rickenella mellea]
MRLSTMAPKVRRPSVLWAQESSEVDETKNRINITINLPGIIESTVRCKVTRTTISFESKAGRNEDDDRYAFNCTLYADVSTEDVQTSLSREKFLIIVPKTTKGNHWPRLTKEIEDWARSKDGDAQLQSRSPEISSPIAWSELSSSQLASNIEHMAMIIPNDHSYIRAKRNAVVFLSRHFAKLLRNGSLPPLTPMPTDLSKLLRELQPDNPTILNELGCSFMDRFAQYGYNPDSELAIANFKRGVDLTPDGYPGYPDQPALLSNLGTLFSRRFRRFGKMADIEQAILNLERAVQLTTDDHPGKAACLNNLGTSFATRFEQGGQTKDIVLAILNHERAVQLTPFSHPDRPMRFSNLGNSFYLRFQLLGDMKDLEHAISHHEGALRHTPHGHPVKPMYFCNLGTSFLERFHRLGKIKDIEEATLNHERADQLTLESHPDKPCYLNNLGNSLSARFKRLGDVADIDRAISNHERAVRFTPFSHPDRPRYLNNLGNSFSTRFDRLGDIGDIEKSILNFKHAIQLTPDNHPDKPSRFNDLGTSFLSRFKRLGEIGDIERALSNHKCAVQLTPNSHPSKPGHFFSLGNSFSTRFERLGELDDIEQAILNYDRGVQLTPDDDPGKPRLFSSLGTTFLKRFERLGETKDIAQAILNHQLAIQLTPEIDPNNPIYFHNLGNSLTIRFMRFGDISDIERAISNYTRAIRLTPDSHPDKPGLFSNLGSSLLTRFKRLGETEDIGQAILNQECAVHLTPVSHPDKPKSFSNLGSSFWLRFEWFGDITDLELAISNHNCAVQLTPNCHPDEPNYLNNLGGAFLTRFRRLGEMEDVEQAIFNLDRAIQLTPDNHANKPSRYSNLGSALCLRFERIGDMADIGKAISMHESAIQSTPDSHPIKPMYLSNLGTSFSKRFSQLGDTVDIEQAIFNRRRAVQLTPDGHSDSPGHFCNLGDSLLTRFERFGVMSDIEQAILNHEHAVQLTPSGHSEKPNRLSSLGNSFATRFWRIGRDEDLLKSIAAYRTAASLPDGPPSRRLYAAKLWSWLAREDARRHSSDQPVLDAYRVALDLLPRVAWVGLSIDSRHHELLAANSLACDAAAAAISENDPQLALAWLEQGRSIVWGQILQLRTPVDELRLHHPKLAENLTQISEQLEKCTSGGHFLTDQHTEREGAIQMHHRLAQNWARIVEQVRRNPGFQRFLLHKEFSELRHATRDGAVVVLNVSEFGCDALIIESLSDHLHHVQLEDLSYEKAKTLQQSLHDILSHQCLRDRYTDRHAEPVSANDFRSDDAFLPILAELWTSVVKPVLHRLESLRVRSLSENKYLRITWCPTGPLAFLPIHAAGLYNADGTSSISLLDVAISSYTPTLSALLQNSERTTPDSSVFKFLAVIQPNTPGVAPLPGTLEELEIIRKHVSDSSSQILEGRNATTSEVLSSMAECSWVHLACHGTQDVTRPMESGLLLEDGRLKLSKIIQQRFHHAEFAFLSACQTATGDENRPEEAIHLAAGMLLAGYRGVVASMWSIRDDDAPFVADKVYSHLFEKGVPNAANAAEALHFAIRELRAKPGGGKFSSWVPFIYMGG